MLTWARTRCGWAVGVTLPAGLLCRGWELSVLCLFTWSCLSLQSHPQLPARPPPPAPPQCWAPRAPPCLHLWQLLQPQPPPAPRASHVSLCRQVWPWGNAGAAGLGLLLPWDSLAGAAAAPLGLLMLQGEWSSLGTASPRALHSLAHAAC